ncbi:MAG: transglycosylase domain-containing protein [Pelagimonas sp.]|jgi:membrane peptidoglycan carboxypeptidase|nr:transglycosylase domain-containing protein [Pelagimonas sp.]
MRFLRVLLGVLLAMALPLLAYGALGWFDARFDSGSLKQTSLRLNQQGQGAEDLGPRKDWLLLVEDPNFLSHYGLDLTSAGSGATTITQAVASRLGFETYRSGLRNLRQTGYALGMESRLSKDEILTLFLRSVEMGQGPDGWMTGFFSASQTLFNRPPADLSDDEFLSLVAVVISPQDFSLLGPNPALEDRKRRITRLVQALCGPASTWDIWLEGCR